MSSLAFIHGWASGPRHSHKIRDNILENGFEIAGTDSADIIVAHSLGSFMVPNDHRANLIVLVNPPYWPRRSALKRITQNVRAEDTYKRGLNRSISVVASQSFYAISRLPKDIPAYFRSKKLLLPKAPTLIVIRNRDDPFCSPEIEQRLPNNCTYLEVPGLHDDIYRHPEKYLEIIKKYAS